MDYSTSNDSRDKGESEIKLTLPGMRSKIAIPPPALERLESLVTSPCVSDGTLTSRRLREMIPCTPSPMYAYDFKLGTQVYDPSGRYLPRFFPFHMNQGENGHDLSPDPNQSSPMSLGSSENRNVSNLSSPSEGMAPITTPVAHASDPHITGILAKIKDEAQANGTFDIRTVLQRLNVPPLLEEVVEISKDQIGSRFLQSWMDSDVFSKLDRDEVIKRVIPEAKGLTTDAFGNYVVQKVVEAGSSEQRLSLLKQFRGELYALSIHTYGCRVVQKLIERSTVGEHAIIAQELEGHVIRCVEDQNGNHVIQKLIEKLPSGELSFIVNEFLGHIPVMAVHCYGCRVVQRLLEKLTSNDSSKLIAEILAHLWQLSQDQYGNYVVQHVLVHGTQQNRNIIMQVIASHIVEFSCHKYASNVAEKALLCSIDPTARDLVIAAVIGSGGADSPLHVLMKDRFANYVIQRCIEFSHGSQRDVLVAILRANLPSLKRVIYGKHIANAIEKIITD
ncbi:hypothetical protein C9890_0127 [Perkinsus sp. BL_2016]|nr:hypothetical protein C9890_0127 [Perkinsus sp. BL_2016]